MNVVARLGHYTFFTLRDDTVEPGKQQIGVSPADSASAGMLQLLTGTEWNRQERYRIDEATWSWVAPHDEPADQRLTDLVDICVYIRKTAPHLIQLTIEGLEPYVC